MDSGCFHKELGIKSRGIKMYIKFQESLGKSSATTSEEQKRGK